MDTLLTHLTTAQLARRWGVKPQTIRKQRMRGWGPPHMRMGPTRGRCLYRVVDVEEWEAQREVKGKAEEE